MSNLTEYLPPFLPPVLEQAVWVQEENGWNYLGEANSCVPASLATIKSIHHHKRYGDDEIFNMPWIYGNRHSQDNLGEGGMYYGYALDKLRADGVPATYDPMDFVYNNNMFYDDQRYNGRTVMGARSYVLSNYNLLIDAARRNTIGSWVEYRPNTFAWSITNIKSRIIQDGAAWLTLVTYDDFFDAPSNGVIPDYRENSRNRNLTIEQVYGKSQEMEKLESDNRLDYRTSGGSVLVPVVPVDPPVESIPPKDGTGHAMAAIGWCKISGYDYWICQNSWGDWWGSEGICYMRMTNPAIESIFVFSDGAIYPQPIKNLKKTAMTLPNTQAHFTWTGGVHTDRYFINYRVRGSSTWIEAGTTTAKEYLLTGLQPRTFYELKVYGRNSVGNGDPAELLGNNAFLTGRPVNWTWSTPKVSRQQVNITAVEWNAFCTRINEFRLYRGLTAYSFTTVSRGQQITASIVNQAWTALGTASEMGYTVNRPATAVRGAQMTAAFFNGLVSCLNSIA